MADWFEYPSNYSNGTSVDGAGSFFQYASYITGDWLGTGIILIVWLLTFGLSMVSGSRKALLTSSFISFIFSIYLVQLDILSPLISVVFIILTIIGLVGGSQERGL